jgi:MFS family permease
MSDTDSISKKEVGAVLTEKTTTTPKHISSRDADITLAFLEKYNAEVPEITPEEEKKLSKKVVTIILLLTSMTNLLLYADKATLSYASIFGLWEDTGLTQNKYNNSSTLFYVGYIIGQINLILVQKLPIGRLLTAIAFSWTTIIFLHCTAYNYQGIYALRFFLGFVEAVALPILNTTMGQFMTANEKAATAPLFYSTCVGVTIPVGFIAYGILYAKSSVPIWKLFFIIIGGCTFIWTVVIFFLYPNNPTDAVFLNEKEKIWVIRRVQQTTRSSIEQKVIKKHQIYEALRDPISWLFFFFFLLQQLANNLPYQQNLLFEGIGGINNLDSTLVSVASGGFAVVCCIIATTFLFYKPGYTAFSVVFWTVPSFAASIAVVTIPWDKKIALLAMLCLASPLFGIPWILMFSWNSATCSGYTKKITRNALIMIGYGIANIISPQLWQEKDGPRYTPAWIVQIVLSFFTAPLLALVIWYILNKRNKVRKQIIAEEGELKGFVDEESQEIEVSAAILDLTDLENKTFIYPL